MSAAAVTVLLSSVHTGLTYWRDPRIHNLGNVGVGGTVHALVAPYATRLIDRLAYGGVDVRARLWEEELADAETVVDLCCGTGLSTRPHNAIGVDTSAPMLWRARRRRAPSAANVTFVWGNAETWGERASADAASVCFALHEMPAAGRRKVLRNALRVARAKVVVMDITPTYTPSPLMLSGEPYLPNYLSNVHGDVAAVLDATGGAWKLQRFHHPLPPVGMWTLVPQAVVPP